MQRAIWGFNKIGGARETVANSGDLFYAAVSCQASCAILFAEIMFLNRVFFKQRFWRVEILESRNDRY